MTEQKFKLEMRRAEAMRRMESDNPFNADYWAGYQRGLRRAYHGENFGTAEEHKLWMSLSGPDESRKQRGMGYRDGLEFGKPLTGDYLKRLRERLGKTQTELAELLSYSSKVHIARLEAHGRRKLPDGAIARVQAAGLDKRKSLL